MSSEAVVPASIEQLGTVMADAAARGLVVGVRGSGSKDGWAAPGAPVDLMVDTRGLDRIVEHAAGDLVVTAQAGVALRLLQERVASAGQWLALDPPEVGATLGGVVATAASGPRRLLYGTPRDLLIGITVVLADGTVARSGGKVVKNVAGYDLGKLFTGSFGTLGVIAECTFRLHPLQPARRVVTVLTTDPGGTANRVFATGAVPAAVEWDGESLVAVFESIESAADVQAADTAAATGGLVTDALPAGFGERPWRDDGIGLKVTHRLGRLREVLAVIAVRLAGSRVRAQVGSGVIWVGTDGDVLSRLEPLREAVAPHDGGVVVVQAPVDAKRGIDAWGPVRGLPVMQRIKDQFDPMGRMSPGRFVAGI
jgi:glycolate oxidase FAD binding subunit